ncbi:MAG: FixH family protein [Alphaproteobacteria bacterium]|nr:FixH family protein [Alphaproteobacteria bacterium]MDX5417238.1 FixH family protein [Alphaproteobacteria bacterium]MDX5494677.1 FixH family protein [Alphaproteobacteria bacterium]
MTANNSDYRPSTRFGPITGWHVLAGFVLFFGIVFGVNGYMIYGALSTFDGIETEGAYQKGRAYNHLLERMDEQRALGWQTALAATPLPGEGHRTRLAIDFRDSEGRPVQDLSVHGTFWRPVAAGADTDAMLREVAPGTYEADFELAHPGNWLVRIAAEGRNGETFVQEQRVVLRD